MNKIFYDFDGTLIDTWPGIEATLRASLHALNVPVPDGAINRSLVGMPLMKVFDKLLEGEEDKARLALGKYREMFPLVGMSGARLFNGVVGMLNELKEGGMELFLVTARNQTITEQMMAEHGINGFFTWVRGEREGEAPDNKIHMVAEVIQENGLSREDCVMVGDRSYDMEAAIANNIRAFGVTYGYGTKEELLDAGALQLAGSIEELTELLIKRS